MADQKNIDWEEIHKKLPVEKDPAAAQTRSEIWQRMDVNGNGRLSLAEIDKGVRDELGLESVFNAKPAIMRAYQAAKGVADADEDDQHSDDYVERSEFRLLLLYLGRYFELYRAFSRVDTGDDNRIDYDEFVKARPLVEKWAGDIPDYEAEFGKIDKNGGGQILFDEFAAWAIRKKLEVAEENDL